MIHLTITQKGLNIIADTLEIPAQNSADIPVQFVKDSNYVDYVATPFYAYSNGTIIEDEHMLEIDSDLIFNLPASAFSDDGIILIAISLSTSDETVVTKPLSLRVYKSLGSVTVLPNDETTWQELVSSYAQGVLDNYTSETLDPVKDYIDEKIEEFEEDYGDVQDQVDTNTADISTLNSNLGDTTLLTTAQTITGAINEVNSNVTITLLTSSSSSATSNVYRIKIGNYIRFVGLYTVNTTLDAYTNVVHSGYSTALGQDTYHNVVLDDNSQTSTTKKITLKSGGYLQAVSGLPAGSYWIDIGFVASSE